MCPPNSEIYSKIRKTVWQIVSQLAYKHVFTTYWIQLIVANQICAKSSKIFWWNLYIIPISNWSRRINNYHLCYGNHHGLHFLNFFLVLYNFNFNIEQILSFVNYFWKIIFGNNFLWKNCNHISSFCNDFKNFKLMKNICTALIYIFCCCNLWIYFFSFHSFKIVLLLKRFVWMIFW